MDISDKRLLVTGGAGVVGAPLAARLVEDNEVLVADDLSNGSRDRVPDQAEFREVDLTEPERVAEVVTPDIDGVFHLAAASKRVDASNPRGQFEANTRLTYNILERMRAVDVTSLAYTSSSTVYGEAPMPTPEDHATLEPISVYGATKLAEEHLCSVYAHSHGFQCWLFRFANIIGPGLRGAVIPDFIEKLRANPETLTILGDGRQEKSYMHVEDCVAAMCHVVEHAGRDDTGVPDAAGDLQTYNLGTRTTTSVIEIADTVSAELGLDPSYEFTGGDRGWTGDVPRMRLAVEKLTELGFDPDLESDAAVERATAELANEL